MVKVMVEVEFRSKVMVKVIVDVKFRSKVMVEVKVMVGMRGPEYGSVDRVNVTK